MAEDDSVTSLLLSVTKSNLISATYNIKERIFFI